MGDKKGLRRSASGNVARSSVRKESGDEDDLIEANRLNREIMREELKLELKGEFDEKMDKMAKQMEAIQLMMAQQLSLSQQKRSHIIALYI